MNNVNISTTMKSKIILIIPLLLIIIVLNCGQGIEYAGDGRIERGFVIYPTFRVIYSEILIGSHTAKTYSFKGLPPDKLILRLALRKDPRQPELTQKAIDQIWQELEASNAIMKLNISVNGDDQLSVGPAPLIKTWTLAAYGRKYYFWRKQFNDMLLENNREYELRIDIKAEKTLSSSIYLVPILEGGGFGKGDIYNP